MIKAVLYCNKEKPYLNKYICDEETMELVPNLPDEFYDLCYHDDGEYVVNGKVVAECDYKVNKVENGYLIQIENIKIYDRPQELSQFDLENWVEYREGPVYLMPKEIKKVSRIIRVINDIGTPCFMVPCSSKEMSDLFNGKINSLIRKYVPEEMKKLL